MVVKFLESILALSKKKIVAGSGLVLGICIGVLGVFLISQLVSKERPVEKLDSGRLETTREPVDGENTLPDTEVARVIQNVLGFEDVALPVFERFSEEKLIGMSNFIEETKQLEDPLPLQALKRLLFGELARNDPVATLDLLQYLAAADRHDFVQIVFEEWSKIDLEAALQATELLNPSQWQTAIRSILSTLPNQGHRVEQYAKAQGVEIQLDKLIEENEMQLLLNQRPDEAWRAIMEDDVSNELQKSLLVEVLSAWIYRDGYQVLDQIYEFRHKIDRFRLEEVLFEVVQHQPAEAFRNVVSLSNERLHWLLPTVLEAWSKRDPEAAYSALETVENFGGTFLYLTIIHDWARIDPASVLQQLESLSRSQREDAASAAMSELTFQDPQLARELLSNWEEVLGIDVKNLENIFVRNWARQNPEDAYSWVQENINESSTQYADMLQDVLLNLAPDDPEQALEIALSQPISSLFTQILFANIVQTLSTHGHIDHVISVLDQIPDEAHTGTFSVMARHLVLSDRWEDAVQLRDHVSENLRIWYYEKLAYHGIETNVHALIGRLDSLPSNEMRAIIAREILRRQENEGNIVSAEQVKHLRSIVSARASD